MHWTLPVLLLTISIDSATEPSEPAEPEPDAGTTSSDVTLHPADQVPDIEGENPEEKAPDESKTPSSDDSEVADATTIATEEAETTAKAPEAPEPAEATTTKTQSDPGAAVSLVPPGASVGNEETGPETGPSTTGSTEPETSQPTTIQEKAETTVAVKEEAATTVPAEPKVTVAPGDPCGTVLALDQKERHYSVSVGYKPLNDRKLTDNWYKATTEGGNAEITSSPIKPDLCGTKVPYHLSLGGKKLPAFNETLKDVEACGTMKSGGGGFFQCVEPQKVDIKNCGDFYIYNLKAIKLQAAGKDVEAAFCVQKPGEIVPIQYLAIFPDVPDKSGLPIVPVDKITYEQLNGTVTTELNFNTSDAEEQKNFIIEFDKKFREMVARALNGLPRPTAAVEPETTAAPISKDEEDKVGAVPKDKEGAPPAAEENAEPETPPRKLPANLDTDADLTGPKAAAMVAHPRDLLLRAKRDLSRRWKRASRDYTADDVHYVGPTPRVTQETLQMSVFVDDPDTGAVEGDRLEKAIETLEKEIEQETGKEVKDIYQGLPRDIYPLVAPSQSQSTWEKHKALFITIIVLLLLLLLILLIGCLCIKCRNKRGSWTANERRSPEEGGKKPVKKPMKKPLTAHESPLADDEIKKDEGNMMERENPAYTANGSGGHIAKPSRDDEQGWIVPFEELNRAERNRPDVQDTKL